MKKSMVIGLVTASMIGAGYVMYNYVLSPRTKRKLMALEQAMCNDLDMMDE